MSGRGKRTLKIPKTNFRTKIALQKLRKTKSLRTARRTLKAPPRRHTAAPIRRSPRLMTLKFIKNLQNITSMPKNMRKTLKTAIKKKRNTSQLVASLKAKAAEAATTAAAAAAVVAELKEAEEKEEEADAELDDVILTFASAKIH